MLSLLPIFLLDYPHYFIASHHLTAANCNAEASANIALLLLTELCVLFMLCVQLYCTLSLAVQLSCKLIKQYKLGRLDKKNLLQTDRHTDTHCDKATHRAGYLR